MCVFLQEHSEERLVELVVLLFRKTGLVESFKIDEKKLRCAALLLLKPYASHKPASPPIKLSTGRRTA